MSASKSAAKRVRSSEKARIRHKSRRSALKTSEKKFNVFVETSELDKAKEQLKDVFKKLDKAVKSGTIPKNKRNRKKSRLSAVLSRTA
jgi:small subunit ribosomal protein S20